MSALRDVYIYYYLRWFVIIHAEAFLKRKKGDWNRSFIVVARKAIQGFYFNLFRLVGWWQSSLGIKKKEGKRKRENTRQMLVLKPRAKRLGTIQFVYMKYTISIHPVIMPTGALEYKFWAQTSRKATEENTVSIKLNIWNNETNYFFL